MTQPAFYLCVNKQTCPVPHPSCTDTATCAGCGREVWVDPKSRALADTVSGGNFVYVCSDCFNNGYTPEIT